MTAFADQASAVSRGGEACSAHVRLDVFGGFRLLHDRRTLQIPWSVQRVLGYLALQDGSVSRSRLAADLWLESPEERAAASLRSALWRLRRHNIDAVIAQGSQLALARGVAVDVHEATQHARRLLQPHGRRGVTDIDHRIFTRELLPDWLDDWVLLERERLRQLCLHALEALARHLLADGEYGRAVDAAMAAVRGEPLRESAQRVLLEVHLTEGNRIEAVRQYCRYRRLLAAELGIAPSPGLERLVWGDGAVTSA